MITINNLFNEGVIRGLINEPLNMIHGLASIVDTLTWLMHSEDAAAKYSHIISVLNDLESSIKNMDVEITVSDHFIQRTINKIALWRHYPILNDTVYHKFIKVIKAGGSGPSKAIDLNFTDRDIAYLYKVKHTNDLAEIVNKYKTRVTEIYNNYKKSKPPINNEFNSFLSWGILGLRDLAIVINRMATYSAKGI